MTEKLENLLKILNESRERVTELKKWLADKEVVEYFKWKQDNPKDRTAMEKVIAQLKLEDEDWMLKEEEYMKWDNRYKYVKNIYDIVLAMIQNPDKYSKEDIDNFIYNLIEV